MYRRVDVPTAPKEGSLGVFSDYPFPIVCVCVFPPGCNNNLKVALLRKFLHKHFARAGFQLLAAEFLNPRPHLDVEFGRSAMQTWIFIQPRV